MRADVMFYGDNTEFRNPFREGETIFGAAIRPSLDVTLNPRVTVSLGAVTNHRFGGDAAFELARPLAAITFRGASHTFVMGTLPWRTSTAGGPDRHGLHGLLPPIQRETLRFERPYEAGLSWSVAAARFQQEAWINWQRLNTSAQRERFDAGLSARLWPGRLIAPAFQLHVVHEGGQLFAAGPVADSVAAAAGAVLSRTVHGADLAIEGHAAISRYVPDREMAAATRTGAGFFARAALARAGWRGHLLFWRGDDFIKEEGDPNYQSRRRDGTRYRGVRDYAETGLARTFRPASAVSFDVSGRLHRVERHYEYSYRLLCIARLEWLIR